MIITVYYDTRFFGYHMKYKKLSGKLCTSTVNGMLAHMNIMPLTVGDSFDVIVHAKQEEQFDFILNWHGSNWACTCRYTGFSKIESFFTNADVILTQLLDTNQSWYGRIIKVNRNE